jgi:hypothetical protein
MTEEEMNFLIIGQVPSVVIEATDDDPEDYDQGIGYRWNTEYGFTISTIAQNLRDRREDAQDSPVPGDTDPGANTIDGAIKVLLAGIQLFSVVDGVRAVRLGRGHNWISDMGQRRIVRSRAFMMQVTELNCNAPNDFGPAEEVAAQAELTDLNQTEPPFDILNYLISGAVVPIGVGFAKPITAASAIIAGVPVAYAGELKVFTAYRDTYRDLLPSGLMTFVEVTVTGEPPAVTATALRIGKTRTDGSSVMWDQIIAGTRDPYMNPFIHPLM